MAAKDKKKGLGLGLLKLPLLLVAAPIVLALSFPYGYLKQMQWRKREQNTLQAMRSQNRVLAWEEFAQRIEGGEGTVIMEILSTKGGMLLWWSPDDFSVTSPYPNALSATLPGDELVPFYEWCYKNYTDREKGTALLVACTREQRKGWRPEGKRVVKIWLWAMDLAGVGPMHRE